LLMLIQQYIYNCMQQTDSFLWPSMQSVGKQDHLFNLILMFHYAFTLPNKTLTMEDVRKTGSLLQ
jgi:hypothetical protein